MERPDPRRPETAELLAYVQANDGELILYRDALYIDIETVDRWFEHKAARAGRGEAVRNFMLGRMRKRIRSARDGA